MTTSIGEQIREARRAKGLTQGTLAEAMNVSRQAVSHWETNRTMPDAETLIRLSRLLEHSFVETAGAEPPAAEQTAAEKPAGEVPAADAGRDGVSSRNRILYILSAAVLALAVLCACLLLSAPGRKTTAKERAYKSPADGETYTVSRFRQETDNDTGKSYLASSPVLRVARGENYDYWMYEIVYHEMNGIAFSIDRIEQVIFAKEKENVEQIFTAADLRAYGMETEIPASGDWSFQGGLPVQDTVLGVGVLLRGTDENGAALVFTAYIPLSDS